MIAKIVHSLRHTAPLLTALVSSVVCLSATAQSIQGRTLPDSAHAILAEMMREAGVDQVVVTRVQSTPEDQVRVMYNFIQRHGVVAAKRMYGPEGDAVVVAYESTPGSAADRKAAMLAELRIQLPSAQANGRLMHLSEDHTVFDLSLARIAPQDSVDALIRVAREHAMTKRVLGKDEGEKDAVHIELRR